jgi:hypothetical protein
MEIDKVCRQLAKELNEDYETVRNIVMFQFYFTTQVMKDDTDTHDILFNKLFRFKLKPRFKENKQNKYSPHEKDSNENNEDS